MPKTDPSSDTGRVLNYSLNQEPYLRTFLENGEVSLDNSDAERSIKKFCVGKKNWQISATKNGAEASGILYSIAETARANGLRPYYYFKHVLETMIPHMDDKITDFSGRADAVVRKPSGSMQGKRKMSGGKSAHSFYTAPGIYHLRITHIRLKV